MTAFLLTITLTVQGGNWTLDINPNITLEINTFNRCGTSWIPHVTTVSDCLPEYTREELIRHELGHHDQWSALGPAFPIAYLATRGEPFEDYLSAHWIPPAGMREACPLFRIGNDGVEFLPCYRL